MIKEEIPANFLPIEVFFRVKHKPFSFFLDSNNPESSLGYFSFVAFDPFMVFISYSDQITLLTPEGTRSLQGDPLLQLSQLLEENKIERDSDSFPLQTGVVGYWGYELGGWIEQLPYPRRGQSNFPDSCLGFYGTIYAYDHLEKKGCFFVSQGPYQSSRDINKRIYKLEKLLQHLDQGDKVVQNAAQPFPSAEVMDWDLLPFGVRSNFTKEAYIAAVKRVKEYIAAGEVYQVNLAQCLTFPLPVSPLQFYYQLRVVNPVPFGAFLNCGYFQVICNSPERFLKIRDRQIETRPIKGTRRRGLHPEEDYRLQQELTQSPKEKSEHLMIVDLERNDLGRVCHFGSVKVKEFETIETYSHIHHMVSTIIGELRPGIEVIPCIKACFPGGSITGAPKIRAMEIIHELEPNPRGVYTGAIGYIDFSGQVDLNIAIRTGIYKRGRLQLWVGGGIVADSNPEDEYQETLNKAYPFLQVLGMSKDFYY